jgi:hypothetical protein
LQPQQPVEVDGGGALLHGGDAVVKHLVGGTMSNRLNPTKKIKFITCRHADPR